MNVIILAESHEDKLIKIIEPYMSDIQELHRVALEKASILEYTGATVGISYNGKKTIVSVEFTKKLHPSLSGEGETLDDAIRDALNFVSLPLEGVLNTPTNKRITSKLNKLKEIL